MLTVVHDESEKAPDGHAPAAVGGSMLDALAREGARRMLAAALQAEVAAYIEQHADQVDEQGRRLVVRNGSHAARQVATAAGAVPVQQPRVNDKRTDEATGQRMRFASAILPAWCRKSPQVADVLPLLYLHGLSSGDFAPALEQFCGSTAGLSPATIIRLTGQWQGEADAFGKRSLRDVDYVYVWVDGIHVKVRLEQDKICLLVMVGVRADGAKELIALADGLLHQRDYRQPQGGALQPPLDHAARLCRSVARCDEPVRARCRAARGAHVSRQCLGHSLFGTAHRLQAGVSGAGPGWQVGV